MLQQILPELLPELRSKILHDLLRISNRYHLWKLLCVFGSSQFTDKDLAEIACATDAPELLPSSIKLTTYHLRICSGHGSNKTLAKLKTLDTSFDVTVYYDAALNGQLETIKWLREHQISWSPDVCTCAALRGDLPMLVWLKDNKCPWSSRACAAAAENGHLSVLMWLRANGCPWDSTVFTGAASRGKLRILEWLEKNGCPKNTDAASLSALMNGHLEVLHWLISTDK